MIRESLGGNGKSLLSTSIAAFAGPTYGVQDSPVRQSPTGKIQGTASIIPPFLRTKHPMSGPTVKELRDELSRLMAEQLQSLKKQVFGGLEKEELAEQEQRLKRIRQVSADYLAALKREMR
jgi:hypothetical protein